MSVGSTLKVLIDRIVIKKSAIWSSVVMKSPSSLRIGVVAILVIISKVIFALTEATTIIQMRIIVSICCVMSITQC